MKEVVLEDVDVSKAIIDYIAANNIQSIVVGASTRNAIMRSLYLLSDASKFSHLLSIWWEKQPFFHLAGNSGTLMFRQACLNLHQSSVQCMSYPKGSRWPSDQQRVLLLLVPCLHAKRWSLQILSKYLIQKTLLGKFSAACNHCCKTAVMIVSQLLYAVKWMINLGNVHCSYLN